MFCISGCVLAIGFRQGGCVFRVVFLYCVRVVYVMNCMFCFSSFRVDFFVLVSMEILILV